MIDDELLAKFDRIQDLPVSEEMLGAYIEGHLNEFEISAFQTGIEENADFKAFVSELQDETLKFDDFSAQELIDISDESLFIDEFENLNDMKDLTRAYNTFGEDGENILDPIFIQQPDDHSCALRSQQIVLRDYGIDIPFDKLEKLALDNGVYTEHGTYTYDIGKVLQIAGVGMHQVEGSSLYDLTNELAQGHRVIVSVDANELWYNDPLSKMKNWFNDVIGNQGGNHALIVAGVEVNPNNPDDVKVVLTDPGAGHLRIEYPVDQFMDAWKDSKCFMAATNDPAPYQYDAESGMEVPSNFMVQQFVNNFIASNGYQLSPDMINIPENYQPAFTGHLDNVGNMDFEDFESKYNEMVASRLPSALSIKEQIEENAKEHMVNITDEESIKSNEDKPDAPDNHSIDSPTEDSPENVKLENFDINSSEGYGEDDEPDETPYDEDGHDEEDGDDEDDDNEDDDENDYDN